MALVLGLTLLIWASSQAQAAPAHELSIRGADGQVSLVGHGTLSGSARSGEIWASDDTGTVEFDNVGVCLPSRGGESCSGTTVRFRLIGHGFFDVQIRGSAISVSSVGRGSAQIQATEGTYTLDRARRRPLPHRATTLSY